MNQALAGVPLDQWKAWDKWQRSFQILVDDHDAAIASGGNTEPQPPEPEPPDGDYLDAARARIFLANDPLEALKAPDWMVPVCTADPGYRYWYDPDTIDRLRARFGIVEAWCDCRPAGYGTPYAEAVKMVNELGLDGPAWGQCETTAEFDHAYTNGARRMVGNINSQVLDADRLAKISSGEVLVTVELYRNLQPGLQPDWRSANAGIGGNCIAIYGSAEEGAVYTPVADYRAAGLYSSGNDSVYGVGLLEQDWHDLG
jgi:hypothetical protein